MKTDLNIESFKYDQCIIQDILVFVNSNQPIIIAGTEEPAAIVTLHSANGINEVDNKLHSAALFSLLLKYLKVNKDR